MKIKKTLSAVICALMLAPCLVPAASAGHVGEDGLWRPVSSEWEPLARGGDVVLRLAVGGDCHIDGYYSEGKLPAAYEALGRIGGIDAFLIAGDVTDGGKASQYDKLMEIVNRYSRTATVDIDGARITATGSAVGTTILSMGNHDDWTTESGEGSQETFTSHTGQAVNKLYWLNGIPIIKMSPCEAPHDSGTYHTYEDFIVGAFEEIDAAGYTGPIIGMAHHPVDTPFKGTSEFYSDGEIAAFQAHPNFILFTGHSHTFLRDTARVICQSAGFTQIRTGTLGNNYGATNGGTARNPETGKTSAPYTDATLNSCQCHVVDVMRDGTVVDRRIDVNLGRYIFGGEEFVIDPANQIGIKNSEGKTVNLYSTGMTKGTFGEGSAAPVFPDGAKVTVEDEGNHDTVFVTFPKATPASDLARDYIWRYNVTFTDESGNVDERHYMNDAHLENQRDEWRVCVVGLAQGVDYTVTVSAQTPYGARSGELVYADRVNVGLLDTKYPAEEILGIDGSAEEIHGRDTLESSARAKTVEDKTAGRDAVQFMGMGGFGYAFGPEDFEKIRYAFTLECYFKASDAGMPQCLLGSINSANAALRIRDGEVFLWGNFRSNPNRVAEDRIIARAPVSAGEWTHAAAVYDGTEVRLYVNGELVSSGKGSGGLDLPPFDEDVGSGAFWVGAMSSAIGSDDGIKLPVSARTLIGSAHVYEGAMTDADVAAAYRMARAKNASFVFDDVAKGAYYENPVTWAVEYGITAGTGKTTFSPQSGCTRGQVVTFLWRAAGEPKPTAKNPFSDVKEGDYYYDAVLWAVENGITAGTSRTKFSPGSTCTRGQIVTFLYRANGSPDVGESVNPFSDVRADDYFYGAVLWAVENGITAGTSRTKFSPGSTCTRGQVVTFMYRSWK